MKPSEDLLAFLRERRSIRKFEPETIPRDEILTLIDAAVAAPSASNKQPWRFLVVQSKRITTMAAAVREAIARIAARIPASSQDAFRAYGDYFTRFENAPLVIVPIHRPMHVLSNLVDDQLDAADLAAITSMEANTGLISTSLALQNILLMADAMGLGASAMTGPLVADAALRAILEVPPGWGIVALVAVGVPAETPPSPGRKSIENVVRWL
jgi:nitroreductase